MKVTVDLTPDIVKDNVVDLTPDIVKDNVVDFTPDIVKDNVVRFNPNASPDEQKAFEKIKHKVTELCVTSEVGGHDYEIAFLPDGMTSLRILYCVSNQLLPPS